MIKGKSPYRFWQMPIILMSIFCLATVLLTSHSAYGQLISPGKLSKAHANLEGITNCTNCHILGQKGVSNFKCLSCHTPLKKLIDAGIGYHATIKAQNCGNCHKEHFGRTFNPVHFDTATFNHNLTGFKLIGKHMKISCRSCHKPSLIKNAAVIAFKRKHNASLKTTFLGLDTHCSSCHAKENPHGKQFLGEDCGSCHTPVKWKDMSKFNHASTSFPLLGKHLTVACSSCHKPMANTLNALGKPEVQFKGIAFSKCIDCHKDPHHGKFGTTCQSCHTVRGWHILSSLSKKKFNHAVTGFVLTGRHAYISCSSCHDPNRHLQGIHIHFIQATLSNTFPKPVSVRCMSCHEDYHNGVFRRIKGGPECSNCHTTKAWLPTTFDIARHNKETRFRLTGAHLAIPCFSCHQPEDSFHNKPRFLFASTKCISCHRKDNPHGDTFRAGNIKTTCASCHNTSSWKTDITFNHAITGFKLTGRHAEIACISCHKKQKSGHILFTKLSTSCKSCHSSKSPHHHQFDGTKLGSSCSNCHNTASFKIQHFNHNLTRFPLNGAHQNVACSSCHKPVKAADGSTYIRYRPLSITCKSCHGTP